MATDLVPFAELIPLDHGLCVLNTVRADGSVQSSVVNAGVSTTLCGEGGLSGWSPPVAPASCSICGPIPAPRSSRAGWRWATVEGTADIVGPDDPHPDLDGDAVRLLLRDIFRAAGGTHDDWDTYDRVMAEERRAAAFIAPRRVDTSPQS